MNNIDFFSGSPNIFIFQKKTNKTTFGGFLFLIYMIIMTLISLMYIIDYIFNDKYIIEHSSYLNATGKESSNPFSYLDDNNNINSEVPLLNFSLNLLKINETHPIQLSERFVILDVFDFTELKRNTFYQKNISKFGLMIMYICEDEDCVLNEDDFNKFDYYIEIKYNGFELKHQENIPLKTNANIIFKDFFFFSFTHSTIQFLNWEIIKYKEEKGISRLFDQLFEKKNEYIGGYISPAEVSYINHPITSQIKIQGKYSKILGEFLMTNTQRQYTEYKRRKISILDVLAKIGALFTTFYSCFSLVFKYYSTNFDNYQIIQTIIKQKLNFITKEKANTKIELSNNISNNSNDNLILNDGNKSNPLIINENNLIINDENIDDIKEKKEIKFKKITFSHFFLNNIYCKSFSKFSGHNSQKIINICNEIISNYLSVESLLYNQILLENLFKDYNWNNKELKKIDNNRLIIQLKGLI